MIIPEDKDNSSLKLIETGFTPLYSFQERTDENDKVIYLMDPNNFWCKSQSLTEEKNEIIKMLNKPEFPKEEFIKYITLLTYQQRIFIKNQFDKETNKAFENKMKLFSEYQESIKLLFINPIEKDCQLIQENINKVMWRKYDVVTEIAASSSNWTISQIKYMFMNMYGIELDKYINNNKSSKEIKQFMISLFYQTRRENKIPNKDKCLQDVSNLIKKGFIWADNDLLQEIIFESSSADLKFIDEDLIKQKKIHLNDAIQQEKKIDSDIKKCINVLLSILIGSKAYYSSLVQNIKDQKNAVVMNKLLFSKTCIDQGDIKSNILANQPNNKSTPSKESISICKSLVESSIMKEDFGF